MNFVLTVIFCHLHCKIKYIVKVRHAMCCKLCSIYQRTVIIAICLARTFIGWSIELLCLNIFLILPQFGKENEKKTMNLTKHFFLCCICWDCSFPIVNWNISIISISQSCLCLLFFNVDK